MIGYLHGNIIGKNDRTLLIDVNGVGYLVNTPTPLLEKTELHLPAKLYIHTNVREDELSLYGFETNEDLRFFQMLISVNGVGPRLAMDLFTATADALKKAILEGNIPALTQMKGVGKKTAERIILELRDKISTFGLSEAVATSSPEASPPEDVLHALLGLGYHRRDITRVFRSLTDRIDTSEELIKYFLKNV